jgi:hypothetical protein
MRPSLRLFINHAAPAALVVYLFFIYLSTMAPGLSWANGGPDGGDLITAAATGGVAHPTGYPVYLLLARIFQLLPAGSLAFRTNLLSACAMVGAAYWIYAIVQRLVQTSYPHASQLAGAIAGLAFGVSPLAWSQAVITEVYALHAFFVALVLFLIIVPAGAVQERHGPWVLGLVLGLAMGNHLTSALLIPVAAVAVTLQKSGGDDFERFLMRRWQFHWKPLLGFVSGLALGLFSYGFLSLWAAAQPPINWGNPVTLRNLWWLVSAKLYQEELIQLSSWHIWQRLQAWANLLIQQFGIPGLSAALIGLVVLFAPRRHHLVTLWTVLIFSTFAFSYRVSDWQVYLISVYLAMSIWIGLGCAHVMGKFSTYHSLSGRLFGLICILYFVGLTALHWGQVDASQDRRAENFGREVLAGVPEHAIVFAAGDRSVFTLWYFHYALQNRPDVFILATDLLPFDWYRETLRASYPDLLVPSRTPNIWQSTIVRENPAYPVCYPYYADRTVLNCP